MKISRGQLGYLEYKKKRAIAGTIAMAVLGIIVFLVGFFF